MILPWTLSCTLLFLVSYIMNFIFAQPLTTTPKSPGVHQPAGNAVLSASADGSVRAFDLLRYRNFRTFASPEGLCQLHGCVRFFPLKNMESRCEHWWNLKRHEQKGKQQLGVFGLLGSFLYIFIGVARKGGGAEKTISSLGDGDDESMTGGSKEVVSMEGIPIIFKSSPMGVLYGCLLWFPNVVLRNAYIYPVNPFSFARDHARAASYTLLQVFLMGASCTFTFVKQGEDIEYPQYPPQN